MNFFFEQSIVNNIIILLNLLCQIFILNFLKNNIPKELILFSIYFYIILIYFYYFFYSLSQINSLK